MILKNLSTIRWFWTDYKYEKSLILQNSSSERPLGGFSTVQLRVAIERLAGGVSNVP